MELGNSVALPTNSANVRLNFFMARDHSKYGDARCSISARLLRQSLTHTEDVLCRFRKGSYLARFIVRHRRVNARHFFDMKAVSLIASQAEVTRPHDSHDAWPGFEDANHEFQMTRRNCEMNNRGFEEVRMVGWTVVCG